MELRETLQESLGDAYIVERELGGGGMSRVFVARETALKRPVVMKVLAPELSGAVSADRFSREITTAAQLQHPHIVPLLSAGQAAGMTYFTMPLVEGQALRARLDRSGALTIRDAARILRDVAAALSYAHKRGIVHRDIKPDNVLLSDGYAMVTDFGVAKALGLSTQEGGGLTSVGVTLGTPAYMAPEQAAADASIDHRADIYSFGVLAYELLCGAAPFAGRPPASQLAAHLTEVPEAVVSRRPEVPTSLGLLVGRCLEKDPDARPQSAEDLLRELESILATTATPEGMPPASRRGWLAPSRARLLLAAAAVLVVALSVEAWRRSPSQSPLDEHVIAVFPFRVSSPDSSLAYLHHGMQDLFAITLSTEAGLRTSDVSAVIGAWRRAGGVNIQPEQQRDVAASLNAGQYVTGEIVGTPKSLVIRAVLQSTVAGERVLAAAEGSADEVSRMVDILSAQLISRRAGEAEDLLPVLEQTALPVLRTYLDGRAAYRRGAFRAAADSFRRAVALDSTFAPAAFGLAVTNSWVSEGLADLSANRARAWRLRERLPPADRLYMEAEFGSRSAGITPIAEQLAAAERLVVMTRDRPEAWYILGDLNFHYGAMLQRRDAMQQALTAFNRSLALDSSFYPASEHLQTLYHALGDSAGLRRATAFLVARDSSADRVEAARWFQEVIDAAPTSALRPSSYGLIRMHAMTDAVGIGDYAARLDSVARLPLPAGARRWLADAQRELFLNGGRPRQALDADAVVRSDTSGFDDRVLHAMFWDGDSAAAAQAAGELERRLRNWRTDSPQRVLRHATSLALWAAARGERDRMNAALVPLRYLGGLGDSVRQTASARLMIRAVETLAAERFGLPDVRKRLEALDSAALTVPAPPLWVTIANMVALRLWDRRGENARALAVARRRVSHMGTPSFHSTMLREEGRLAELTGDREGAIRAYTRYLALRYDPEPEWQAHTQDIAQRLEQLKAASAGR